MNNYRTHLDFELRETLDKDRKLRARACNLEEQMMRAAEHLENCIRGLEHAKIGYEKCREEFRNAHGEHMGTRQMVGELREDYFATCEDEVEWH